MEPIGPESGLKATNIEVVPLTFAEKICQGIGGMSGGFVLGAGIVGGVPAAVTLTIATIGAIAVKKGHDVDPTRPSEYVYTRTLDGDYHVRKQ